MPPVTTHVRVNYNSPSKTSSAVKSKGESEHPHSPQRRRRPRSNLKTSPKATPKNITKNPTETESSDTKRISYDRDSLLALRQSPLSTHTPELPSIPGVTAPRIKEKKMPESLRLKLLKRGVVIREPNGDCELDSAVDKQKNEVKQLSLAEKCHHKADVLWQSCVLKLV